MLFNFIFVIIPILFLIQCNYSQEKQNDKLGIDSKVANSKENCKMKPDRGPCRAMIQGYWYNAETKQCREFVYGGCQGSLPFSTKEDCEKICN